MNFRSCTARLRKANSSLIKRGLFAVLCIFLGDVMQPHPEPPAAAQNARVTGAAPRSPASAPSPIEFDNAIATSKITFTLKNSVSPERYSVETMAGGVAVFDYNNDGLLDIFFTNGAEIPSLEKSDPGYFNRLFRNNGDGTFTDVTEQAGLKGTGYSMGVAAGDYDNDGFEDLYIAGVNRNQLFHNNGDGTFTDALKKPASAERFPLSARLGRLQPDGLTTTMTAFSTFSSSTTSITVSGLRSFAMSKKLQPTVRPTGFTEHPTSSIATTEMELLQMSRYHPMFRAMSEKAWASHLRTTITMD